MVIRSPIICMLGHVDHGKTSLLDAIRGSAAAKKEAGGITQMIGASYISKGSIEEIIGNLREKMKIRLDIPGILFIDTPGHEAFNNLRERGGSIADLAALVVDIKQGFQPQTVESIKILKAYKTPFVIAANKIDLVEGWKRHPTTSFLESFAKQSPWTRNNFDEEMYKLIGKLSEYGFDSERFDRITDFSKQLAIIPTSAKTGEGIGELLLVFAGLSQKFLETSLKSGVSDVGKGSILEVREEKGLGITIDVIIYEGVLRKNDDILFLTENGARSTKVRGLLEISEENGKLQYVDEVAAAAGVKIYAPGLEGAIPGSPITVISDLEKDKEELERQLKKIIFESADAGVVVKADSLGSVEALLGLLKHNAVPVREAGVGKITRKDVLTAKVVAHEEKYRGAILGFNVPVTAEATAEAEENDIPIIWGNIIYEIIDRYMEWIAEEKAKERKEATERMPWPGKIKILSGCCFRVSKPAIFGVRVLEGRIKPHFRVVSKDGRVIIEIKSIQHEKETLEEAVKNAEVAISSDEPVFGKDLHEGDILYVYMTKSEIEYWKGKKEMLTAEELEILREVENIFRMEI